MKKLHSFAVYALVTPILTLGAASALAQQSASDDMDNDQQRIHKDKDASAYDDKKKDQDWQSKSNKAEDRHSMGDKSGMKHTGYMDAAPANGLQASSLIGTGVKTTDGDDDVGSVSDLIIDENGQIVAVVVGVGGFLGMGDRDVAIGWDEVTRSGNADDLELRIDVTRDELRAAPKFELND